MDRDLRPATPVSAPRNPYLTALGVIGALGIVVGLIAYIAAANIQPDYLDGGDGTDGGVGAALVVGNLSLLLGMIGVFLWLTAAAITWRRD